MPVLGVTASLPPKTKSDLTVGPPKPSPKPKLTTEV